MKLPQKIISNPVVNFLYRRRQEFDIGVSQVSWVTGKIPEIAGVIILLDYMKIVVAPSWLWLIFLFFASGLWALGISWKRSGLFDVDCRTGTRYNPVMLEIWEAAKIIKANEFKKVKRK